MIDMFEFVKIKYTVLRSIKPYFLYLILTGKKRVEIGKDMPKSKEWNRRVLIYCSKDMNSFRRIPKEDRAWMREYLGKVACCFVCPEIIAYESPYDKRLCREGGLTTEELNAYGKGKTLYAWSIEAFERYSPPYELSRYAVKNKCYADTLVSDCSEDCQEYELGECDGKYIPLTRPPQSWCYIEKIVLFKKGEILTVKEALEKQFRRQNGK